LARLYSNIICKNIVKCFQKFDVGYIQTCTFLKSNTMWHPKGDHRNVLSPLNQRATKERIYLAIYLYSLGLKFIVQSVGQKVHEIIMQNDMFNCSYKFLLILFFLLTIIDAQ
jgi:hypothetical protein